MRITWDSADVDRVFQAYPMQATARLLQLIEGEAIDTQRLMRQNVNVGATGRTRRAIKYRIDRSKLGAEIYPDVPPAQAEALEKGSRPHWTSVKPGSDLRRWADHKGINPFALQKSIAMKGTKAHPFVGPTFQSARVTVPRNITRAFGRFIEEVNNGRI